MKEPFNPIFWEEPYDQPRRGAIITLSNVLLQYPMYAKLSQANRDIVKKNIEEGAFMRARKMRDEHGHHLISNHNEFAMLYSNIIYEMEFNLNLANEGIDNADRHIFVESVINNIISPVDISSTGYATFNSKDFAIIVGEIQSRLNIQEFSHYTERYKCSTCKMRKCTVRGVQTRSGDENRSDLVTCLHCSKQWIVG